MFGKKRHVIIHDKLTLILEGILEIMSTQEELKATLDGIQADVAVVVGKLDAQSQAIADLQAQLATGVPVTQEQLDGLKAEADSIKAALDAVSA